MCNTGNSNKQCNNDHSNECNTIGKYHINNDDDLFRRKCNLLPQHLSMEEQRQPMYGR